MAESITINIVSEVETIAQADGRIWEGEKTTSPEKAPVQPAHEAAMQTPGKQVEMNGDANAVFNSPTSGNEEGSTTHLMTLAEQAGFPLGVPRGVRGEGPPFAPLGWSWRVGARARINRKGIYVDSFRKHPDYHEFGSKKAVGEFLKGTHKLPTQEVDEIQKSYEWHIPASADEISKDIEDVRASTGGSRGKRKSSAGEASSLESPVRKRTTPPLFDDFEVRIVEPGTGASAEQASEELPTLDEFLAPANWLALAKRLRRLHRSNPDHIYTLEEEANKRGLSQLRTQLLAFKEALVPDQIVQLPHSLLSLVALIMTEGRVDDVHKKKMRIADLVKAVQDEVQPSEDGGAEVPPETNGKRPKRKRKSFPASPWGVKADAAIGKGTQATEGAEKRTRKSVGEAAAKAQEESLAVKSVLEVKPSASMLSVAVDEDEPTDEEVDQAWAAVGTAMTPDQPNGHSETPVEGLDTPSAIEAATAALLAPITGDPGPSTSQGAAKVLLAGPVTQQDLEILEYKKKLHKLERVKRDWDEAFDEKLAIYRAHKEALEQLVAKRRQEQEAQRKKIEEEKAKLRHTYDTALKSIQELEAVIGVPDVAAEELAQHKSPWDSSLGPKVQAARDQKQREWQETMKEMNDARRMNVDHLKMKIDVYIKLGKTIPEEQIQAERDRSAGEYEYLSKCLEEQKEKMERELERYNAMEADARTAFVNYKAQLNRVEKEESKLQHMLKQGVV